MRTIVFVSIQEIKEWFEINFNDLQLKLTNFDEFDKNAAILFCSSNKKITATTRLIFDSPNHLPTENITSFEIIRNNYQKIAECDFLFLCMNSESVVNFFDFIIQNGLNSIVKNVNFIYY